MARGRHRRRLVQRDAADGVPVLPRRRHAERARRRRPGRRAFSTSRSEGLAKIHAHEVGAERTAVAAAGRDRRLRGVRPPRPRPAASARSASAAKRCRRRSSAASSTRRSTSPSGPACTVPRTSTGRSARFPTARSASAPGRSTPRRTSIGCGLGKSELIVRGGRPPAAKSIGRRRLLPSFNAGSAARR